MVKVPHHFQLVKTALEESKIVYWEWPLGNGTQRAETLTAMSQAKDLRTFLGLQAVSLPETLYVKQVVAVGLIGEVLFTTLVGSGRVWGELTTPEQLYLLDPANGATMLDIPFGHVLVALVEAQGDFQHLNATLARRRTESTLLPVNSRVPQLTNDQLAVTGILANGVVAALHY